MHLLWKIGVFFLLIGVYVEAQFPTCVDEPDSYCIHETCAQPLYDEHVGEPCECAPYNIGSKFSACNNGARDLIYYWKPPATCLNATLPPPVSGFPCDFICQRGQFINVTSKACDPCPPGSVTDGSGHILDEWVDWPGQFTTTCAIVPTTAHCESWQLNGETIYSGDNHLSHYLQSSLEWRVELVVPGYIAFRYTVSAEPYFDGLYFVVDDVSYFFVSNTYGWVTYNRTLSAGFHTIKWIYYKDRLITAGLDRAEIDFIEIFGTTFGYTGCEACPPGHYQPLGGQYKCTQCPAGQYSPTPGATACLQCRDGFTSFPGSTSCFQQSLCSELLDYFYVGHYTNCINGIRTLQYDWIYPLVCTSPQNATLPSPVQQSCVPEPCPPGQFRSDPNQPCQYCPLGYSSNAGATSCQQCLPGTSSDTRLVYLNKWDSWPQTNGVTMMTNCIGSDCYTPGWRLAYNYIDSGYGHGLDAYSYITLNVAMMRGGSITFNYSLPCSSDNELIFILDNFVVNTVSCSGNCGDGYHTWTLNFRGFYFRDFTTESQIFNVTLAYQKHILNASNCDFVKVSNIIISGIGSDNGGAASCNPCRNGTYASMAGQKNCTLCDAGYSSAGDHCVQCPMGTFSDKPGMQCISCGLNSNQTLQRTSCALNCSNLSFNGYYYNLTNISGEWNTTFQTFTGNTTRTHHFLGSVCSWSPSCVDNQNQPLDSYLCYVNNSFTVNLGKSPSVYEVGPRQGLRFEYTNGNLFPWGGRYCSSSLTIFCDLEDELSEPELSTNSSISDFYSSCIIEFIAYSKYACPVCRGEDIAYTETDCINGQKSRSYYAINKCLGSQNLPQSIPLNCSPEVTLKSQTILISVLLALLLFGLTVAVVIYLVVRNRKLHHDYMILSQSVPLDSKGEENFPPVLDTDADQPRRVELDEST